jgi:ClpP class serine protease
MMIEDRFASEMTRIMRAIEQGADPANLVTPIHATPLAFVSQGERNARRVMEERGRSLTERGYYTIGSLAVLPVMGPIWQGGSSILTRLFGGTTMGAIASAADLIAADDAVSRVLLHLDTPGGTAHNAEAHLALRTLAATKPMIALASVMACSAGYDMACYADEIVATATAMVGSVGSRYGVMYDESESAIMEGVRAIPLTTAKHKLTGAFGLPIDDEQVQMYERMLWHYGDRIIGHVSESRGIDRQTLIDMQGACYVGTQGVEVGLVDRVVETAGELLAELAENQAQGNRQQAQRQGTKATGTGALVAGASVPSQRLSTVPLSQEPAMAETKNGAGQAGTPTATAPESSTTPITPNPSAAPVAPVAAQAATQASAPASIEAIDAIAAKLPAEGGVRDAFVVACVRGKVTEAGASALLVESALGLYTKAQETITAQSKRIADLEALGEAGRGVAAVDGVRPAASASGSAGGGGGAGKGGASGTAPGGQVADALGIAGLTYTQALDKVAADLGITRSEATSKVNADPVGRTLRAEWRKAQLPAS